jgi:2-succinyl-6-hydroxy-2,4-cyclohexadiene-1-carboxylate synthase
LNGVQRFVEQWLAQPLFRTLPAERHGLAERLLNTPAGLASSLRLAGTGTQLPLWDQLGQIGAPVLVMAGELDSKFSALGQQITAAIHGATFRSIPGAGHAAHLEYPTSTATVLRTWLDATRYAAT